MAVDLLMVAPMQPAQMKVGLTEADLAMIHLPEPNRTHRARNVAMPGLATAWHPELSRPLVECFDCFER